MKLSAAEWKDDPIGVKLRLQIDQKRFNQAEVKT